MLLGPNRAFDVTCNKWVQLQGGLVFAVQGYHHGGSCIGATACMRCDSHVRLAEVRLVTAWPGIGISVHLQALCTRGLPFTDMLLHLSLAIQTPVCIRAHERRSGERGDAICGSLEA